MKIIYPQTNGEIAIVSPVLSSGLSVEEIARKDVPAGAPYLIVLDTDIPADLSTSAAWECDFSSPTGYGIGPEAWFAERAAQETSQ